MLKTVFDHVIDKIINLVQKQIDEVEDHGIAVKVWSKKLPRKNNPS
jgi:hypothetical protein